MKKNQDKIYALALYESLEAEQDTGVVIGNFLNFLKQKGLISRIKNILREFEKIYNQKEGIINLKIKTARKIDGTTAKEIASALGVKKYVLTCEVDKDLIGGFIAEYGDNLINASVKNNINKLYKLLKA